ncbi:hypothetical protein TNCV_844391 [Trichonephila clavipes]|uniref:Uncharacterized protein n=1 Tax=Trichonephila clavipes TaxID=2585209 RepID=A0A8X6WI45_TRICX|nr:hypothetical protein TNCV_844391 [Trichonephila clavipes]
MRAIDDVSRNFEPWSSDENNTWPANPLSVVPHHANGGSKASADLTCISHSTRRVVTYAILSTVALDLDPRNSSR